MLGCDYCGKLLRWDYRSRCPLSSILVAFVGMVRLKALCHNYPLFPASSFGEWGQYRYPNALNQWACVLEALSPEVDVL